MLVVMWMVTLVICVAYIDGARRGYDTRLEVCNIGMRGRGRPVNVILWSDIDVTLLLLRLSNYSVPLW